MALARRQAAHLQPPPRLLQPTPPRRSSRSPPRSPSSAAPPAACLPTCWGTSLPTSRRRSWRATSCSSPRSQASRGPALPSRLPPTPCGSSPACLPCGELRLTWQWAAAVRDCRPGPAGGLLLQFQPVDGGGALECDKIGVSYKYALVSGWGCHGGARGVQGFMPSHFNVGGPAYT